MTILKSFFIALIIGGVVSIGFALHEHVHSERWGVKTLSDGFAANMQPVSTTVDEQCSLPNPETGESVGRLNTERTVYTLDANLLTVKKEFDGDYHLVLEDPVTHSHLIAEIPDTNNPAPECYRKDFAAARSEIDRITGKPGLFSQIWGRKPPHPTLIRVTGIGFFDEAHIIPQSGMATNNREIHPILGIASE
jgi:hypothetical protein